MSSESTYSFLFSSLIYLEKMKKGELKSFSSFIQEAHERN